MAVARPKFTLTKPSTYLGLFRDGLPNGIDLDDIDVAEAWSLAGLAALARRNGSTALDLRLDGHSDVAAFARAIGVKDAVLGIPPAVPGEEGRTYKLRRVTKLVEVERAAADIARMILPSNEEEETRKTIRYVLVELMRNAVQHSGDPKGGVVGAQKMKSGYAGYPRAVVQVAVADAGVGIPDALRATYPDLTDDSAALVKALEPHVSGAFGPGRTGTAYNAGMGLFFISELAKLTAGRLMVASRGAALVWTGDLEGYAKSKMKFVDPRGTGFPGTLVAFELPLDEVADHAALIEVIADKARARTPRRDTSHWVRFEPPPRGVDTYLVSALAEDVDAASALSRERLQPPLFKRQAVALDFRNIAVCTQSFAHALLYEAIRLSWAVQVPIYIENAEPAVATAIRLVDGYARGG